MDLSRCLSQKASQKHLSDSGPKRDEWGELQSSWCPCLPSSAISIQGAGENRREREKLFKLNKGEKYVLVHCGYVWSDVLTLSDRVLGMDVSFLCEGHSV